MAYTCSMKNCSNGAYWLDKWKRQLCETCGCLHKETPCNCEPPFRLFAFPTRHHNPEGREKWKQLVGRRAAGQTGSKLWSPSKDSRVCSRHFAEGEPTSENPLPTEALGYDGAEKRVKRMTLFEATSHQTSNKKRKISDDKPTIDVSAAPIYAEDPIAESLPQPSPLPVPWIITLLIMFLGIFNIVREQDVKIKALSSELLKVKHENLTLRRKFSDKILKTDDDVSFYTGLGRKSIFEKLHSYISPLVNRRWLGVISKVKNIKKFSVMNRFGPGRKLNSKSEFLMTLMKLRLGLLNKDLAKRFNISETLCSRIFLSWLRASHAVLKSLVVTPDEEALIGSKPDRFRELADLHSIIDCTEIFIETPKDLLLQSQSWSDYKHHNTLKILVVCSPNSSIIYTSPAYLGRVSDKALTVDCGYLDQVPPQSMIMADKGFNISEECENRSIRLYVPPGKRGQSQMTCSYVEKTKRIANKRILIEQVIRRLKTFRILASELPISLCGHIDEIVVVCAGLSNLKMPIYKI